jgi:aldehyde:ferredoxin oxidoreductase
MGSNKLKGMVVSGDKKIEVSDKPGSEAAKRKLAQRLKTDCRHGQICSVGMRRLRVLK